MRFFLNPHNTHRCIPCTLGSHKTKMVEICPIWYELAAADAASLTPHNTTKTDACHARLVVRKRNKFQKILNDEKIWRMCPILYDLAASDSFFLTPHNIHRCMPCTLGLVIKRKITKKYGNCVKCGMNRQHRTSCEASHYTNTQRCMACTLGSHKTNINDEQLWKMCKHARVRVQYTEILKYSILAQPQNSVFQYFSQNWVFQYFSSILKYWILE